MKALLQRISIAASGAMALSFMYGTAALAAFAGDTPAIPGTPGSATEGSIRTVITNLLVAVLNFLALVAVIVVVIAGIRLIVSQGEDDAKDKAKKMIIYALIGLIIVLFARVIVGLITTYIAGQV